jgi:hypothetical protein
MTGTIQHFINVSTDEVYGETSLGKEHGEQGGQSRALLWWHTVDLIWWRTTCTAHGSAGGPVCLFVCFVLRGHALGAGGGVHDGHH